MFARIEIAVQAHLTDPAAVGMLRRIELAEPTLRKEIRWARLLEVFWLDLPTGREEAIPLLQEIFWDPVTQWLFTGNLIPAAAGKSGSLQDLLENAPQRPGKFWGLEKKYRAGVTDNLGKTAVEALEILLGRDLRDAKITSGQILILEGQGLTEKHLQEIAKKCFCNELIETFSILPEEDLLKSDRFHQERIRSEMPRMKGKLSASVFGGSENLISEYNLADLSDSQLQTLSQKNLWALNLEEMQAIRTQFEKPEEKEKRNQSGLTLPTDVEMEILAQTWSEHCKHKIFAAEIEYHGVEKEGAEEVIPVSPAKIPGLFKTTIAGTTSELPRSWLLSVFSDNAGIVAIDEEDAVCIKVETHNSPSALDPYGGALTGIVGVNRDILGCGLGAKPIGNTNVFCTAEVNYQEPLPEGLMHPRRILDGIRRGVEHGGNKSGIPTINGALVFDKRYLGKPLVYCGTIGMMPRSSAGRPCERKEIVSGDRICMVGGRIGKDGIHGATFSSLALDETSPTSAVQLGDPITQKRMSDFLLEARDLGLYRAITDNGAGGLSSSVGELAQLTNGARMDVGLALTKYPGLKPYELVISESQERMTVAVPPENISAFCELAKRRGVEVSDLGEFNNSGRLQIDYQKKCVADLDLRFLHKGNPQLKLTARWKGIGAFPSGNTKRDFLKEGQGALLQLLERPNIASKEWLIRQYDHEVQGMSVIKPLHTASPGTVQAFSGPNDAAVLRPKSQSWLGIAVGCGIVPRLSDVDCFLMAQAAVDEAIRNILCVGAEFGRSENLVALVDNFCWPDPVMDEEKAAALVRACYGLRDAAFALGVPLISGKDSMKNDFRGKLAGKPVQISVPPTLLMTALARVPDVRQARTSDFKSTGDRIYLLGAKQFGLVGSELAAMWGLDQIPHEGIYGKPHWPEARALYGWLGNMGSGQSKLRSVHDVSDGGVLTATVECALARGFGVTLQIPSDAEPWNYAFGEGFHGFVVSASEADASVLEQEWTTAGVPFRWIGRVGADPQVEVHYGGGTFSVPIESCRKAWKREGYWE